MNEYSLMQVCHDDPISYLLVCGLSHVQDLSSQWEHSVAIAPDDSQSGDSQRLG